MTARPLLWLAGQWQACRQHRARPRAAHAANNSRRCHQSGQHQRRSTANARASLPPLRRPHDDHRALRARRNPALSPKPANSGDQHRYLMTLAIRSHASMQRVVLAARLNTSRAQANSLLAHHFFVTSSLLALQIDHCKCPTADHGAQSLQLSTRASTHPARAPLKSP